MTPVHPYLTQLPPLYAWPVTHSPLPLTTHAPPLPPVYICFTLPSQSSSAHTTIHPSCLHFDQLSQPTTIPQQPPFTPSLYFTQPSQSVVPPSVYALQGCPSRVKVQLWNVDIWCQQGLIAWNLVEERQYGEKGVRWAMGNVREWGWWFSGGCGDSGRAEGGDCCSIGTWQLAESQCSDNGSCWLAWRW